VIFVVGDDRRLQPRRLKTLRGKSRITRFLSGVEPYRVLRFDFFNVWTLPVAILVRFFSFLSPFSCRFGAVFADKSIGRFGYNVIRSQKSHYHLSKKALSPAILSTILNINVIGPNKTAIAAPTSLFKSAVMNAVSTKRKNKGAPPFVNLL
jgi:hypothetical protein